MKIGLCLSGGGARGAFHMGVLQAIDESRLKISILSGCSAGALVGCLYAAGVKPEAILKLAVSTRWFSFLKPSIPNRGLIGMDYLQFVLKKHIPNDDFHTLKIPLKIAATNISNGTLRIFDKGEVIKPVLASCSVPLLFKPVIIGEAIYLDGGILSNLPASAIKNDCDFLIGVSLMPLLPIDPEEINSSFKLLTRVLELSVHNNSKLEKQHCDILIETKDISAFSRYDLKEAEKLYQLGYLTCMQRMNEIRTAVKA